MRILEQNSIKLIFYAAVLLVQHQSTNNVDYADFVRNQHDRTWEHHHEGEEFMRSNSVKKNRKKLEKTRQQGILDYAVFKTQPKN